jgi:hypothetical protein
VSRVSQQPSGSRPKQSRSFFEHLYAYEYDPSGYLKIKRLLFDRIPEKFEDEWLLFKLCRSCKVFADLYD